MTDEEMAIVIQTLLHENWIGKNKVKEAFEPTKIRKLLVGSPFERHPEIIQRIVEEELGLK